MIAIPLLQYCMDVKSNMALYRCFKANAFRFLRAAIVSFFDGTSCVCHWRGISGLRRIVDELKRTNQDPRWSSTLSKSNWIWKRAAEHGIVATVSTNSVTSRQNWAWLTGPWSAKFISVKICKRPICETFCPLKIWHYTIYAWFKPHPIYTIVLLTIIT